jgi:ribosomal protein S12 methylthiotransferase
MKKVNIITLGCAKNENDTENLTGFLQKKGLQIEQDPAKADTVIVHTCSFIELAKKESVETILEASKVKKKGAQLIVSGCMVQQHGDEMTKELPEVDAFLGTGQLHQIPDLIQSPRKKYMARENPGGFVDPDAPRVLSHKGPTATLRLSEGCSHPCSFCVIPKLRGSLKSRSQEKILAEAQKLAALGIKELLIIGQDTGDWGRDIYGEKKLPQLLRQLRDIKGIRWIRLMYMHPYSMSDEIIDIMAESPELFPYLDMPIQHIDNTVLREMRRLLGEYETRNLIDKIRSKLPHLSLRTTLIAGYPGETEQQFKNLVNYIKEGHFNYVGSFTYSKEENTHAAANKKQLPQKLKEERQQILADAQFDVAAQKARRRLGKAETIILDGKEGDHLIGRTKMEAPEIDAIVRLPKKSVKNNTFVKVNLTGHDTYEFEASL